MRDRVWLPLFDMSNPAACLAALKAPRPDRHAYVGPRTLSLRQARISDPASTLYRGHCACGEQSAPMRSWQACFGWHRDHARTASSASWKAS